MLIRHVYVNFTQFVFDWYFNNIWLLWFKSFILLFFYRACLTSLRSTSIPGPSRWDGDEDPGKIHFIVPKFWGKNRMRSETQPYSTVLQYGCVALRIRFFLQNFGTIKWILPGSSSPSHREGPRTEVGLRFTISCLVIAQFVSDWCFNNSHANSHDLLLVIAIDFIQRMFYKSIRFACLHCTRFMFYKFQTC